mmetsp:Transcript_25500/g.37962  ORF Transcript_25500/g.37962 Transcript_25500/m.37962 type:complete len:211 (-) Transcript_25500:898-1530(-)
MTSELLEGSGLLTMPKALPCVPNDGFLPNFLGRPLVRFAGRIAAASSFFNSDLHTVLVAVSRASIPSRVKAVPVAAPSSCSFFTCARLSRFCSRFFSISNSLCFSSSSCRCMATFSLSISARRLRTSAHAEDLVIHVVPITSVSKRASLLMDVMESASINPLATASSFNSSNCIPFPIFTWCSSPTNRVGVGDLRVVGVGDLEESLIFLF